MAVLERFVVKSFKEWDSFIRSKGALNQLSMSEGERFAYLCTVHDGNRGYWSGLWDKRKHSGVVEYVFTHRKDKEEDKSDAL